MPFDAVRDAIAEMVDGIPDRTLNALITVGLVAVAVAVALAAYGALVRLSRRLLGIRHPFLTSILVQIRGPMRFAFILLALNVTIVAAPLSGPLASLVSRTLQVAFISFVGWMTVTAVNVSAVLYLSRFNFETKDNLLARKHITQVRILKGALNTLIIMIAASIALMTIPQVRQFGVSLFASAGIAGIVAGLAARPMLSNLIAGIQLAITQPIRIDDVVVVEGEFGNIEEIRSTYVVVRLWDWRRMVVPLTSFIEKPFQNWTLEGAQIIGSVMFYLDYEVPVARVREKVTEVVKASKLWDGAVVGIQVTDCKEDCIEVRALMSSWTSGSAFDLRCEVREKTIDFLQREYPRSLPRRRQQVIDGAQETMRETESGAPARHVHHRA